MGSHRRAGASSADDTVGHCEHMDSQTIQSGRTARVRRLVPVRTRLSLSAATLCILAAGLVLNVYLAVVARSVSAAEYSYFGAFWSLALLLGFGAFLPVEQEVARSLRSSTDRAATLRNAAAVAAGIALASLAILAAAIPLLWPAIGGRPGTVIALAALSVVSAVQFVVRGLLIGLQLLGSHGLVQLIDASLRLAFAGIAVLLISPNSATFAWTVVFAIAVAHFPLLPGLVSRAVKNGSASVGPAVRDYRAFAAAVGPLLFATVCGQLLLNGIPVLVSALASPGEQARAGQFVAAFLLTRLPLLVVVALQTALIPVFVRLASEMARTALASLLGRLASGLAALGAIGSLIAFTVGPATLDLIFGSQYRLPGVDLALMTAGVSAHIGLLVVTQALIALRRHYQVGVSWLAAIAAAIAVFVIIPDLLLRAELAFLAGSLAGWLVGVAQIFAYSTGRKTSGAR